MNRTGLLWVAGGDYYPARDLLQTGGLNRNRRAHANRQNAGTLHTTGTKKQDYTLTASFLSFAVLFFFASRSFLNSLAASLPSNFGQI